MYTDTIFLFAFRSLLCNKQTSSNLIWANRIEVPEAKAFTCIAFAPRVVCLPFTLQASAQYIAIIPQSAGAEIFDERVVF
mmetsp:Transcript_7397/g.11689  ORF Transcript_7397/g.11689 Transcript_7397/m.11689 type:complete len:80 (+) Transcript_7397:31-270(+)